MKKLAAEYIIIVDPEDPDTGFVADDTYLPDEQGEIYNVIQFGFWWWKKFAVVYWVADTAAGGVNSGDRPVVVSNYYKTRVQARIALKAGHFRSFY